MTALNKQALTDEAISQAFTGTNFGRDDLKNILSETVIDAAAGWHCGHTATTICTQLGLLTATGRASALGLRFVSEHVQRETTRLKGELEAAEKRITDYHTVLNNLAAVARRYLPDYDEHPEIQAADELLESAAGIGVKGE
ncbi:TPA: ead/Ea22-like family protein [Citrobacter freundii]